MPMVTGELVAERARTLLPWGAGSGRSRAVGFIRCPEELTGPASGERLGAGRW